MSRPGHSLTLNISKMSKIQLQLLRNANRRLYPSFQMVPFSVTFNNNNNNPRLYKGLQIIIINTFIERYICLQKDTQALEPRFQGHDNIQRQITPLIVPVSGIESIEWFRFQLPSVNSKCWVTLICVLVTKPRWCSTLSNPVPDKTKWRLISATLCGWRRCFVADQLRFMTRLREEEVSSNRLLTEISMACHYSTSKISEIVQDWCTVVTIEY